MLSERSSLVLKKNISSCILLKMKIIWILLAAVVTISNAKSLIDNVAAKEVDKNNFSKILKPSSYIFPIRRNSSVFTNMPDRSRKFIVNLKPAMKDEIKTIKPEKYSKRLMKKLPIKFVNYKDNAIVTVEITTRRTLMQTRKFTVKPHDVYAESIREKYNWNSNRKINTNNVRKSKNERYATEKNIIASNEAESSEQRFSNFKNVDMSINDNDSNEFSKQEKQNGYVAAGSQKSKIILLLPKRNNKKNLKVDPELKIVPVFNQSVSESNISPDVVNNEDHNDKITEEKEKSITTTKVVIKSDPKENFSEQEKADHTEFMFVKQKDISVVPVLSVDDEVTTDRDLDFFVL